MVSYFIQYYCFIYLDVRFAPDLTTRSPFKLASVSFWPNHLILWALPCFWVQEAHLVLFLPWPCNRLFLQGALVVLPGGEWYRKSSSGHQVFPLLQATAASRPFLSFLSSFYMFIYLLWEEHKGVTSWGGAEIGRERKPSRLHTVGTETDVGGAWTYKQGDHDLSQMLNCRATQVPPEPFQ